MKVLVVDDDTITREMLRHALVEAGYEVGTASDGKEALDLLRRDGYRLIVSDWEMPNMNGLELCEAIRSEDFDGYVYFILLTTHGRPQDIIDGLSAGADDYVTKPFNANELLLRVRAILRRAEPATDAVLVVGPLELDTLNHQARVGESNLALTGAELRILEALMRSPGKILSVELLTQVALGRPLTPYDRSLHTHIRNLRSKIRPHHTDQTVIRNIRGAGYVLIPDWK